MEYEKYIVQPGDSIYKISKAYGVSMTELIKINQLQHPERVYPGQVLIIPGTEHEQAPPELPEPYFTYAAWLYEAYAGKDSELSAVTTYLYQAVVLDRPEFDTLLRPIAFDELNHLEQLGRALRRLGVDPRYGAFHKGHWMDWRSKYLNYSTDLCVLLEMNLQDEAKAQHEYLDLAQKIPIPEIQTILTQMAMDEERHYQSFLLAKQQFCAPGEPVSELLPTSEALPISEPLPVSEPISISEPAILPA